MKFNFLINVQLFSQFDQNTINGVEVIAIISPSGGEVQDD